MGEQKRIGRRTETNRLKRVKTFKKLLNIIIVIILVAVSSYSLMITKMYDDLREHITTNPNIPVKERNKYMRM